MKKPKTYITYNNCEIPAKLFYNEVIGKSNLSVLGRGSDEELNKALYAIIDELTEIEDNTALIDLYRKRMRIASITLVMTFIDETLYQISFLKLTDEQRKLKIDRLNGLPYIHKKSFFDINKDIKEEIIRWQNSVKGMLKNRLNDEIQDDVKKTDKAVTSFESQVASINRITGCRIQDTDTLRQFVAFKKEAEETIKAHKKQNGR